MHSGLRFNPIHHAYCCIKDILQWNGGNWFFFFVSFSHCKFGWYKMSCILSLLGATAVIHAQDITILSYHGFWTISMNAQMSRQWHLMLFWEYCFKKLVFPFLYMQGYVDPIFENINPVQIYTDEIDILQHMNLYWQVLLSLTFPLRAYKRKCQSQERFVIILTSVEHIPIWLFCV